MIVSWSIGPLPARRAAEVVLVLAMSLGFSGCWVTSINPLYDESRAMSPKDPDIVFDPILLGIWIDPSDRCGGATITSKDNDVYELQSVGKDEGCTESDESDKSDKPLHLRAKLVKLDSHYFMDVFPSDEDVCAMCLPQHTIFLTQFDKTHLSLIPIDSNWLKNATAAKAVTLTTLAGDTDTITSSSKDLKAFCRKYAENKEVFKADSTDGARLTRK